MAARKRELRYVQFEIASYSLYYASLPSWKLPLQLLLLISLPSILALALLDGNNNEEEELVLSSSTISSISSSSSFPASESSSFSYFFPVTDDLPSFLPVCFRNHKSRIVRDIDDDDAADNDCVAGVVVVVVVVVDFVVDTRRRAYSSQFDPIDRKYHIRWLLLWSLFPLLSSSLVGRRRYYHRHDHDHCHPHHLSNDTYHYPELLPGDSSFYHVSRKFHGSERVVVFVLLVLLLLLLLLFCLSCCCCCCRSTKSSSPVTAVPFSTQQVSLLTPMISIQTRGCTKRHLRTGYTICSSVVITDEILLLRSESENDVDNCGIVAFAFVVVPSLLSSSLMLLLLLLRVLVLPSDDATHIRITHSSHFFFFLFPSYLLFPGSSFRPSSFSHQH